MRKVTREMCERFEQRRRGSSGNTSTDGDALFLFGNKIAEWRDGQIWITTAGWDTVTTRERLNGLTGVSVTRYRGNTRLNGIEWGGDWIPVY